MQKRYARPFSLLLLLASLVLGVGVVGASPTGEIGSAQRLGNAQPAFSDQTEAAGVSLLHSPPLDERPARMTAGAAAGDFNNDGWVDLFVLGGGLRPDALFMNNGDGTFTDQASQAGVDAPHLGAGVAVADYDDDGWLDIYVTSWGAPDGPLPGKHRLFRNNGDGTFTDVAKEAGVNRTSLAERDGFGAAFGDYDLDGDLDLYVGGWFRHSLGNRLFQNQDDGTFIDVTEEANLFNEDMHIFGFTPCFADMDGDSHPELLLAADIETSRYYINNGDGTFTDYTDESGTSLEQNGMGATVADFNNDGKLDWYVTAVHDNEQVGRGSGNRLYLNQGGHLFHEVAEASGANDGGWGWGIVDADVNLEGLLDIVETNGWIWEAYVGIRSRVWINNGDGTYREVAEESGFDHVQQGRGMVRFDYDRDGDLDFAVTSWNDELHLYRNDISGPDTNWLQVALDTSAASALPPNGFGSKVIARIGGQDYYRSVLGCCNYLSQSELVAHFGLGNADQVDELRVEWPNGDVTTLENVAANQIITVEAAPGEPVPSPTDSPPPTDSPAPTASTAPQSPTATQVEATAPPAAAPEEEEAPQSVSPVAIAVIVVVVIGVVLAVGAAILVGRNRRGS